MYLNPSYTIQFPEITEAIMDYYANVYNHDNLIKNRFKIQDRFIEDFVPWINQGHIKFKGLKDFGYVYITNGVSEAITVCMLEHNLRPIVNKDDYPGYMCQAIAFKDSLITLRNRTKFLSLPYYNTADEHPDTIETLQEKSFIDLAWAGGSGLQKTYDVGKTEYVSFSFSKMFGIQYHRIGILFSKKPIKTFDMFKKQGYVNLAGIDLIQHLMKFSPSYFYDKYRNTADAICKRIGVETTKSLWFGLKDGVKVPLYDEWINEKIK